MLREREHTRCAAWGRGLKEDRQQIALADSLHAACASGCGACMLTRHNPLKSISGGAHYTRSFAEERRADRRHLHTRDAAAQPCCAGGLWLCVLVGPRHAVWPVDHPGSSVHLCACVHPNVCPLLVGPDCAGRVERRRTTRDRRQLPLSAPRNSAPRAKKQRVGRAARRKRKAIPPLTIPYT